eukprot:scaffold11881_cov52-Phaeocystis_antarctica.AAC.9
MKLGSRHLRQPQRLEGAANGWGDHRKQLRRCELRQPLWASMGRREDMFPDFRLQHTSRDQLVLIGSVMGVADQRIHRVRQVYIPSRTSKNEGSFHFPHVVQELQLALPALHVGLARRRPDEIREPQYGEFARHRKVPVTTREAHLRTESKLTNMGGGMGWTPRDRTLLGRRQSSSAHRTRTDS